MRTYTNIPKLLYHKYRNLRKEAIHQSYLLAAKANKGISPVYPDVLCIGAPRTGTTWLYKVLIEHPDVFVPKLKESHFFDEPVYIGRSGRSVDINACVYGKYLDMDNASHWRWYSLQYLEGIDKIKVDITPAYSRLSEERIELIASRLNDVKIIYIIRDPVERAWSGVRNFALRARRKKVSDMNMDEMLDFTMHPRRLMSGDYRSVIKKWERYFEPSQIQYLFYDDLATDPTRQMQEVCSFLGVDPARIESADKVRRRVNKADEQSEMPVEIMNALKNYYSGQIPFLQEKFDRDFSHWIYG